MVEPSNQILNYYKSSNINNQNIMKNNFSFFQFFYNKEIFSFLKFQIDYQKQDPYSYYSGGFGNYLEIKTNLRLKSFEKYMLCDINLGLMHLGERQNNSRLNYIEYIPDYDNSYETLKDINFIKSEILISVSDFMIKYEWKNITEIFFNMIKNNDLTYNPDFPSIKRQINLSVEWHFNN